MQDDCVTVCVCVCVLKDIPCTPLTNVSLPKPTNKKRNVCDGKSLQLTIKSHNERFWVVMDGWEKRQKRKLFITTHLRAFG